MAEAILYNRHAFIYKKHNWDAAFNNQEFIDAVYGHVPQPQRIIDDPTIHTHFIPEYYFYNGKFLITSIIYSGIYGYIGSHAFENCTVLSDIRFSSGGTFNPSVDSYIKEYAFANFKDLENIWFEYEKGIDEFAFYNCSNLKSIQFRYNISDLIWNVGSHAFDGCLNLETVWINHIDSIYEYAFYNCSKLVYGYSIGSSACKNIGQHAFDGCTELSGSIYINYYSSSGVSNISEKYIVDSYAFNNCSKLRGAVFQDYTDIKPYAFNNCISLSDITIQPSINYSYSQKYQRSVTIDSYAFNNCSSLIHIRQLSYVNRICSHAFENCVNINLSSVGEDICGYIEDYAFSTVNISELYLNWYGSDPSKFSEISSDIDLLSIRCNFGSHAFDGLSNLSTLTIINGQSIYETQFISNSIIKSINFGDYNYDKKYLNKSILIDIGSYAFKDCINLSALRIEYVDTICEHAFDGCIGFSNDIGYVSMGYLICLNIEEYAFNDCINISKLDLNNRYFDMFSDPTKSEYYDNRMKLSSKSFDGLNNLKSIQINGCGDIPSHIFENHSQLNAVGISALSYGHWNSYWSSGEIDIGEYAFANISTLSYFSYCGCVRTIKSHAFENCKCGTYYFSVGNSICQKVEEYAFANFSMSYLYLNQNFSMVYMSPDEYPKLTVESYAFDQTSASTIWIANVESLSDYAFNSISNILTIDIYGVISNRTYGGANPQERTLNLRKTMFNDCPNISNLYLYYINTIEEGTFSNYSVLNWIDIGSVYSVGAYAFYNCQSLQTVNARYVSYIDSHAFEDCSVLNYTYFNGLRSIGSYAFKNCINLESINDYNCNYIGEEAFAGCISLSIMSFGSVVPILVSIDAFSNIMSDYIIYVPSKYYLDYINDSMWGLISDHISVKT